MNVARKKSHKPVRAAGGIVTRTGSEPLFAVVQMQKFDAWVLPKGKLNRGETAIDAARREVLEETGYEVSVHEFAGTLAYEVGGRQKIVQFWRMQALSDEPTHELMDDIRSVRWLPLDQAVAILTHLREREFLRSFGAFMAPAPASVQTRPPLPPAAADFPVTAAGGQSQADRDRGSAVVAGRPGWYSRLADTARGWLRRIRLARAQC
jgi:8-oxo-dGTP diphosphatase